MRIFAIFGQLGMLLTNMNSNLLVYESSLQKVTAIAVCTAEYIRAYICTQWSPYVFAYELVVLELACMPTQRTADF